MRIITSNIKLFTLLYYFLTKSNSFTEVATQMKYAKMKYFEYNFLPFARDDIKGFFYLLFIKISLWNLCSESLRASNFEILIENSDIGDLSSITVRKECLFACQFWYWGWEVGRKHSFVNFCFVPHKYYFLTKSNSFTEVATLLTKMKYFE